MNKDKITTLTQCEEVIGDLIMRDGQRAQLKQQISAKLIAFNKEIQQIQNLNVSQQVRSKVKEVKNIAEKLKQDIIAAENNLSCEARFTQAVSRFSPSTVSYDKANFTAELKNAFNGFNNLVSKLINQSAKSVPDVDIVNAAKGYAIIVNIDQNIDRLLAEHLREPAVKEQRIRDAKQRMAQFQSDSDAELNADAKDVAQLCPLVEEFVEQQAANKKKGELSMDSQMGQEFKSDLTLHLGIAKSKQKKSPTLQLNSYDRTVKVPSGESCYDIALYGGSGNMLITYNEADQHNADLYQTIESIIMKFILCYPAAFKNVAVLDNIIIGSRFVAMLGSLRKCCPNQEFLFEKQDGKAVYCTPQEIKDGLAKITGILSNRESLIGDNILTYNMSNQNNAESLTLVILKDLDFFNDYNDSVPAYLNYLLNSGPRLGIFTLFVGAKDRAKTYLGDKIQFFSNVFEFNAKEKCLETETEVVACCNGIEEVRSQSFHEKIIKSIESFNTSIDFLDFQKSIRKTDKVFSHTLSIPIGKNGSDPVSLDLTAAGPASHAVISGATGSGKTAFLHNMILSAAYNYSPEQLELWLFDLKQGAPEFYIYRDLKHVKFLSLNSQPQDILESLDYLVNVVMESRATLAQTVGASSIYEYNDKVADNKKMSRIMIIIDEYQELSKMRSCQQILDLLEKIIRQGRSYGISLVLGSQKSDSSFSNIYSQIIHKLVFLSGSLDNDETAMRGLIDSYNVPRGAILKGTCIYQSTSQITMRGALVRDKESVIKQLSNEKYRNSALNVRVLDELKVVSKDPDVSIKEMCAYNDKEDVMYMNVGVASFSGEVVKYKVDYKNTRVLLLGDSQRVQHLEYVFMRSFGSVSNKDTCCYYIDASSDKICGFVNRYRNSSESKSVTFADSAQDISDAICSLYAEYQRRSNLSKQEVDSLPPIEVIIHGADMLASMLNSASKGRSNDTIVSDMDLVDEDDFIKMVDAESSRASSSAEPQDASWSDMLKQMTSNRRLKMYFVVHIENAQDMDTCVEFIFGYGEKFKDVFVVPDKSGDDIQEVYANTYEFLRKLSEDVRDFAEMYNKGSGQLDQNKLNYMVLVDENKPQKFLPYEYEDK